MTGHSTKSLQLETSAQQSAYKSVLALLHVFARVCVICAVFAIIADRSLLHGALRRSGPESPVLGFRKRHTVNAVASLI